MISAKLLPSLGLEREVLEIEVLAVNSSRSDSLSSSASESEAKQ
jgi:hypothetical protein